MVKISNLIPSQSDSFVRGLLKIVAVFAAFFMYSCNDDDAVPATERLFTIQLGDKKYKGINASVAAIKNCERLSIATGYDKPDGHFSINFDILKNGALHKVTLVDFTRGGDNNFETADFNPVALMKITNFKYDEATNYVHFEYSGELINVRSAFDDTDKISPRLNIQGVVTIKDLMDYECKSFLPTVQFKTPTITFTGTRANATYDASLNTNPYIHRFYSNNGYRAIIKSKVDLWNLDKGTYTFDQNTIENRIDLEQYTGIFRATQLLWIRTQDWKKFQTSGSYTIKEHLMINGLKVTKGEMNLQVYDNGVLLHSVSNGKFEVLGFN
ncbi:MAG: hypothetical protein I4O51_13205 [Flavobacterium micromati]|nr:hypothetical protein [Flavobacterium micromati]